MKTSRYIQNFVLLPATHGRPDVKTPLARCHLRSRIKQKMNNHQHLGRKLDDSLPDFEDVVVRGFWKC
ncbi:hypothetical protein CAL16_19380 [Klebsiella quasipneumoniae]|nr:hypothetical protein BMD96_20715 [Klebsiella quasipneumoniae subsp. similipneumoniae]OVV85844.1 hypothetical protein BME62_18590 [Klebsiella quasipneumoniae subsp. similipneumoniae]OWK77033.1 hypothetical protein CAL16_19380 [Klebsiella quasipneumoniae]OWK82057.1 hypothetical protein CAK92_19890 [Klebsiella quasipneumoniae]